MSTVTITFNDNYLHLSDMRYSVFDLSSSNANHTRRCIDGKITGSGKCVGYCTFYEHEGFLTRQLRQEHDCLKKGCRYYVNRK